MKITLKEFNFEKASEWEVYLQIFEIYLRELHQSDETCDDLKHVLSMIYSEAYHKHRLKVYHRKQNHFYVCRIYADEKWIGFCDYICYLDEDGKCVIGNFYLQPDMRNQGIGSIVYEQMEERLIALGGKYIELAPEEKAISFYKRKGFQETSDRMLENELIAWRKYL